MKQFYAVKWGSIIRISDKVGSREQACLDCFGMVSHAMKTKPLGSIKTKLHSAKWRGEMLESTEGWS